MRFFFPKQSRVVRQGEFTSALRHGTCAADATLVVYAVAAVPHQPARIGITIPKKVGGAVERNRWKRLIREAFRTQQDLFPAGFDFIVRPKKGARPAWSEIKASLPRLARQAAKGAQSRAHLGVRPSSPNR